MQKTWREALLYLLALVVGALLLCAVSFLLVRTSYAGVSDEGAVEAGVAAFPDYLKSVARAMAWLGVAEIATLFATSSGLVLLFDRFDGRSALATPAARVTPAKDVSRPERVARANRARDRAKVLARWIAIALAVHLSWLGAEARRHPGLFLPILSASSVARAWLVVAPIIWPAILALSAFAWARFAVTSRRAAAALFGTCGAALAIAWLAVFELRVASPSASAAPPSSPNGGASLAAVERRYPNILLVGVDSLRPDKIDATTTPALARLCRESIYFPNTLVTLPRTAPSWAALLTSLPPLANGVETMFPTAARSDLAAFAMPAHLASLGYATTVVSEYAGESFGRMKLGFQTESTPRVELEQILGQGLLGRQPVVLGFVGQMYTGPEAIRRLLPAPLPELMRGLASFAYPSVLGAELAHLGVGEQPWFALVFYSQPHFPYTSSRPFDGRYTVAGADPALRFGKDVTHGEVRTDADRAQIEALYRSALAETDAAVGDLLARLAASGDDDTIVVLTADHGEGLYECPTCVGHGDNLRGMMSLRVPLAFKLPSRRFPNARASTVPAYASHLDVYPTLLALLDKPRPAIQEGLALLTREGAPIPAPADRIFFAESGEWLWPTPAVPPAHIAYPPITSLARIEQGRIVIEEPFLPTIRAAKHRVAVLPPWKLLYAPSPSGVAWQLFDIERDPWEEHDVSAREPQVTEQLRAALRHSVLRFPHMLAAGDFFLTRPTAVPEEYY